MSDISNRFIIIAVSLLVTIALTSSIMIVIGYFKDAYAAVGKTDISIRRRFTEFDMYDNTEITGLDAYNIYNKYKSDPTVKLFLNGDTEIDKGNVDNKFNMDTYHLKYFCTYELVNYGVKINLEPKY